MPIHLRFDHSDREAMCVLTLPCMERYGAVHSGVRRSRSQALCTPGNETKTDARTFTRGSFKLINTKFPIRAH